MENEIGGETEMEERTGGQRKGRRMGKPKKKNNKKLQGKTEQGQRVSPHPSVIYSSFQSSRKNH